MKLEIARGLFLGLALSVTAIAAAAWQEPGPRVLEAQACTAAEPCPTEPLRKQVQPAAKPDANLLVLMFGLRACELFGHARRRGREWVCDRCGGQMICSA